MTVAWACILLACAGASADIAQAAAAEPSELRVHIIDVGQGDAVLVVSPTGKTVLVDAGPIGAGPAVAAVLRAEKIKAIDLLVLSHAHADHIGGMGHIVKGFAVSRVMDPGFDHPSATYRSLLSLLAERKIPLVVARAGQQVNIGGGAVLEILGPREPLLRGTRSDANSNSIVARLVYGNASALLTGDAEDATEKRLFADESQVTATVLKVAHHGSRFSSSQAFLGAVRPKAAIISCGADNRFSHPHPELLARLGRTGADIYRTDVHGTVTLRTQGEAWSIHPSREGPTRLQTQPRVLSATPLTPATAPKGTVFASRRSQVYHQVWCGRGLRRITLENLVSYPTAEAASAEGKRAAKDCGERPTSP